MDHYRAVALVVGADIFELEPLRKLVVDLDGAQLPASAQGVLHHKIKFRPIKRCFALDGMCFQSAFISSLLYLPFSTVPQFIVADIFFPIIRIPKRHLGGVIVKTQRFESKKNQINDFDELRFHLVGSAKYVGVVLGEAPHPREAMKFPTLLIAVNGTELGKTHGQIAIRSWLNLIDFAMVGAVHGFQQKLLAFIGRMNGLKRVLTILFIVTGGDIKLL